MKSSFLCIGLLFLVLLVTAGCVPITTGMPLAAAGDTRGGTNPTDPVSPLPTPTPTATDPVSPLPTPTPTDPVSPLPTPTPTNPVSPLPTPTATATSPVSPLAAPTAEQVTQANANAVSAPASLVYVVHRGDTLARIAGTFGVSMRSILNANPQIRSADRIIVGQRLTIPSPTRNF